MFFFRSERFGAHCLSFSRTSLPGRNFLLSFGSKFGDSELYLFFLKYISKITTTQCVEQVTCMSWSTSGRRWADWLVLCSAPSLYSSKVVGSIPSQGFSATLRGFSPEAPPLAYWAHLELEDGNGVGGKWQFASV